MKKTKDKFERTPEYRDQISSRLKGLRKQSKEGRESAKYLSTIAKYSPPDYLNKYSDLKTSSLKSSAETIGKYQGEVAKIIASWLGLIAYNKPEAVEKSAETIGKYQGEVAKIIASQLGRIAYNKPEAVEKSAETIGKYQGDVAKEIATQLGGIAYNKPEAVESSAEILGGEKVRTTIGKYPEDVAKEIATQLEGVVYHKPKAVEKYCDLISNSRRVNKRDLERIPQDISQQELEKLKDEKKSLREKIESIGIYRALKNSGVEVSAPSASEEWKSEVQGVVRSFCEQNFKLPEKLHPDFEEALKTKDFISCLLQFTNKYPSVPKEILSRLVTAYATEGARGIAKYKVSHELSNEQLSEQGREKIFELGKYAGKNTQDLQASPLGQFETTLQNLRQHIHELGDLSKEEKEDLKEREDYQEEIKSFEPEVRAALESGKEALLELQKTSKGKTKKQASRAMGLLKYKSALDSLDSIRTAQEISGEIENARDLPIEEQSRYLNEVKEKYSDRLGDLKFSLEKTRRQMQDRDKPQTITISNLIGVVDTLQNIGQSSKGHFTARISHNLGETLTIGRYGNSGQGNCQKPEQSETYNHSLMSFLGDANEEVVIIKDQENDMVGFVNLHGVKVNGKEGFIVENVYTNESSTTSQQEEAVNNLLANLKKEGLRFFRVSEKGQESDIEIQASFAPRYLESLGSPTLINKRTIKKANLLEI